MKVNFRIEGSNKNLGAQIEKEWEEKMTSQPTVTPDKSDPRGMSCIVEDWSTRIFPSFEEITNLCHDGDMINPGCVYLRQGKDGVFECHGQNKTPIMSQIEKYPNAKKGCDTVLKWKPRFGVWFVGT